MNRKIRVGAKAGKLENECEIAGMKLNLGVVVVIWHRPRIQR